MQPGALSGETMGVNNGLALLEEEQKETSTDKSNFFFFFAKCFLHVCI